MPKNCRLSFHQNLILTQQTSIPIMKFEVLWAYEEVSAKIAMWGNPMGTCQKGVLKNFQVAWRIRKGPDPKIFGVIWERLWAPLQATQENFWFMLNHGLNQLLIFPLIEISGAPKGPPSGPRGFFSSWGILGCCTVHPDPVWSKSEDPLQDRADRWELETLLRLRKWTIIKAEVKDND